tara:strand:- start:190 stop:474 length:285 start_codon:yes stop_codon:yes gene_type:complete
MSWDKILKRSRWERSNIDEIRQILENYSQLKSILEMVHADMIPLTALLENNDFEQASSEWEKMKGGIMDLEGTMAGIKEINNFITKILRDDEYE